MLRARDSLEEAERSARHALRLAPDCPEAHNALGLIHYAAGRLAEAENTFHGALRLRPGYGDALLNLGVAQHALGRLGDAEASYRAAADNGADPAQAASNLGQALLEQGHVPEAEASYREALRHQPDSPDARTNLAQVLLLTGRYPEGWRAYESRWQIAAMRHAVRDFPQPRWTGPQPVEGRTVLLHAEQGFGDTLQFCRYAPLLAARGARVVAEVQRPLVRLLSTLRGISHVVAQDDPLPGFDLHSPLMSLPHAFGTTIETIPAAVPYLAADQERVASWRRRLAAVPGPHVGLVWAGSSRDDQPHAAAINRRRSMTLATMAPLASAACSFVSLQLGPPARQTQQVPLGMALYDVAAELGDFSDTAALVAALDLVISVDSAVAHLAGALGRPVWLLNRYDSCWRWLRDRDDSPWYPTLRQFRQLRPSDWDSVMERVRDDLEHFAP